VKRITVTPKSTKKSLAYFYIFFLTTFLGILIFLFLCFNHYQSLYQRPLITYPVTTLSENWTLNGNAISLPSKVSTQTLKEIDAPLIFEQKIDLPEENLEYANTLCFYAYYSDVLVQLDGQTIAEHKTPADGISNTLGAHDVFVALPENCNGKTLTLTFTPDFGDKVPLQITAPMIGEKGDLLITLAQQSCLLLVLNCMIIFLGILLILFFIQIRIKMKINKNLLFLGLFALASGVYMLVESRFFQGLAPYPYRAYCADYISLMMIPIIVTTFLYENLETPFRFLVKIIAYIASLILFATTFMNFILRIDYRLMLPLIHASMILAIACMFFLFFMSHRHHAIDPIFDCFAFIGLGSLIDIIRYYYFNAEQNLTLFFNITLIFFILFEGYSSIKSIMGLYHEKDQREFYEHLAFTDILTQCKNRLAYARDLETLENRHTTLKSFHVISVDLNDLKHTNDIYGHAAGDQLIKNMASVLKAAIGQNGTVYRVGGDEFVIFLVNKHLQDIKTLITRLKHFAQENNKATKAYLAVHYAFGCATYDPQKDKTLNQVILRADIHMYENKRQYHSNLKTTSRSNQFQD